MVNYNLYYKPQGGNVFIRALGEYYTEAQFAAYKTASGQDANSAFGDPLFTNSFTYTLRAGSPAIATGTAYTTTTDFTGATRTGNDIGAYDYVASSTGTAIIKNATIRSLLIR
jgi:hypothetical protein